MSDVITPHMSEDKVKLLNSSLERSNHYLEYGIGGSTVLAAQKSLSTIIAIESSLEWVQKIKDDIEKIQYTGIIKLIHANIGKTKEWGYPINNEQIENWPKYYYKPWELYVQNNFSPDLILIDGRFRTSCFLYCLLQARPKTRLLWDDYTNRPEYHIVEKILAPQGVVGDMAIFEKPELINNEIALNILFENIFNLD